MNDKSAPPEPEFSVLLAIDKIPAAGLVKNIEADEAARRRLMKRFDLLDLSKLKADLTLQSARAGQAIRVSGHLTADVIQKCGVTNESVPDHIESDIDILYTVEAEEEGAETFVDPTNVDIEPIVNGTIDLGELMAQNLGITLNPYPRKPGAVFESVVPEENIAPVSPLAKLAELTKQTKDKSKK